LRQRARATVREPLAQPWEPLIQGLPALRELLPHSKPSSQRKLRSGRPLASQPVAARLLESAPPLERVPALPILWELLRQPAHALARGLPPE